MKNFRDINIIRRIYYFLKPLVNILVKIKKFMKIFDISIFVPDVDRLWGYDFKEYFIKENMPERVALLKRGLDEESIGVVDRKIDHFLNFPLHNKYSQYFRANTRDILFSKEEIIESNNYRKNYFKMKKKYRGYFDLILQESFYFHHGLKFLSKSVYDYIKDKDFLDLGAYEGDSSVVFNEYSPSKVYAFEINDIRDRYYSNFKANNIDISKYEFINKGVSKERSVIKLENNNFVSLGTTIINNFDDANIKGIF